MGIESVVDESSGKVSHGIRDAMCPACEMAVVWMQNELKQNQTQDHILDYVNEVKYLWYHTRYILKTMLLMLA